MTFSDREAKLSTGTLPFKVGGNGRPILYLHSAGGVRLSQPLQRLAGKYCVYVPTFPGFDGSKTHDGVASMQALADLAAEFIGTQVTGSCDVIGHSFGGWVAMWLAARHPDKVDHLVLETPAGLIPEGKGGLSSDPEVLRRQLYAHPERMPPEKPIEIVRANRAMLSHYHQSDPHMDHDLVAQFDKIQCLTLVLAGASDSVIPADSGRLLKARLPHSYLVYVHDAAHNIETDQPEFFNRVVGDFLTWGDGFLVKRQASA
ncbi:MAG: alpha/beta fold hydrolase [Rhizobiales bacterium]|nr:alpha/beta fold hydrolase [Hyphomicrobiales bacterium]